MNMSVEHHALPRRATVTTGEIGAITQCAERIIDTVYSLPGDNWRNRAFWLKLAAIALENAEERQLQTCVESSLFAPDVI